MEQIPLFIGGVWRNTHPDESIPVINPATEEQIGLIAKASLADIEDAAIAAEKGFATWKQVSALERATIMHKAASLIRERAENIALILTTEHGKPLGKRWVKLPQPQTPSIGTQKKADAHMGVSFRLAH